jgi:integrase
MRQATKRLHLTKKIIESIPSPKRGRVTIYDDEATELGLRILPSGKRAFIWFKRVNGKARFELVGYFPQTSVEAARGKAREHTGALEKYRRNEFQGPNPFDRGVVNSTSVESVAEEWLTRDVKQTRTAYETERILRKEILPAFKGKFITDVARADVLRILDAIVDRGAAITANRTLSTMKRWLNWAVDRGYLQASPIANLKDPSKEKSRERVLDDEELRDVWNASGELECPYGPYLRLLILTAQRRGEVAGITWNEIDLDKKLWTLSAARTKPGRVHDVPLSEPALEILRKLPRFEGPLAGPHAFTTTKGKKPINSFTDLRAMLDAEILKRRKAEGDESPLADFTLHDIRRTAATAMAKAGVPPHVLSATLNHTPGSAQGVTSIYNRFRYSEERRAALEAWGKYVLRLVEQKAATKPKRRLKVARG